MKKQQKQRKTNLAWSSNTKYIDVETGEVLQRDVALRHYKILKITKYVQFNRTRTGGHIEWTKHCKRDGQGKLWPE